MNKREWSGGTEKGGEIKRLGKERLVAPEKQHGCWKRLHSKVNCEQTEIGETAKL